METVAACFAQTEVSQKRPLSAPDPTQEGEVDLVDVLLQQRHVVLQHQVVLLADVVRLVAGDRVDRGLRYPDRIGRVLERLPERVHRQPAIRPERRVDLPVQPRADRPAPALGRGPVLQLGEQPVGRALDQIKDAHVEKVAVKRDVAPVVRTLHPGLVQVDHLDAVAPPEPLGAKLGHLLQARAGQQQQPGQPQDGTILALGPAEEAGKLVMVEAAVATPERDDGRPVRPETSEWVAGNEVGRDGGVADRREAGRGLLHRGGRAHLHRAHELLGDLPGDAGDRNCPSSDNLRLFSFLRNGGSGSSGFEVMRPAADAASVCAGLSGA